MQENLRPQQFLHVVKSLSSAETPAQTAGPFYPGREKFTGNTDLTTGREQGEVVIVRGRVQDENRIPLAGALVEIWQACASGRYNHEADPNPAALDPGFRYWGDMVTGVDGSYEFKTVVPGIYPAEVDWDRPPHIHFKVTKPGYRDVVTQMYWKGHPLNDVDQILLNVPEQLRGDVLVEFQGNSESVAAGHFTITMLSEI